MPTTIVSTLNAAFCQFLDDRVWLSGVPTFPMPGSLSVHAVTGFASLKMGFYVKDRFIRCVDGENNGYLGDVEDEDDDDELCPVECVREFYTDEEFTEIIEKAKLSNSLVVVDFYRTSCGSCKYIEQGFSKLCKSSGDDNIPVIFLKHNVMDEYDEQSEVAERLRIKYAQSLWQSSSQEHSQMKSSFSVLDRLI